jgi:uncharacterized coiled-coil protein SlyX
MISAEEARKLLTIGELNKAIKEAERYIDECIKKVLYLKERLKLVYMMIVTNQPHIFQIQIQC